MNGVILGNETYVQFPNSNKLLNLGLQKAEATSSALHCTWTPALLLPEKGKKRKTNKQKTLTTWHQSLACKNLFPQTSSCTLANTACGNQPFFASEEHYWLRVPTGGQMSWRNKAVCLCLPPSARTLSLPDPIDKCPSFPAAPLPAVCFEFYHTNLGDHSEKPRGGLAATNHGKELPDWHGTKQEQEESSWQGPARLPLLCAACRLQVQKVYVSWMSLLGWHPLPRPDRPNKSPQRACRLPGAFSKLWARVTAEPPTPPVGSCANRGSHAHRSERCLQPLGHGWGLSNLWWLTTYTCILFGFTC